MGKALGKAIARQRGLKGLTQAELGALVGRTPRTVGGWERGENHPRKLVGAIEVALDMKPGSLESVEDGDVRVPGDDLLMSMVGTARAGLTGQKLSDFEKKVIDAAIKARQDADGDR